MKIQGTEFQKAVCKEISKITLGETRTYKDIDFATDVDPLQHFIIDPFIGSGSLPMSPNGQPRPVGEICVILVKLPVEGAMVPQSCTEPGIAFTA